MAKERISSNVERQTRLRVKKAAETLNISESKFIGQAVQADLDKLDIRLETAEARKQRDRFKAKMEEAETKLNEALEKIKALENRGLLARILNRSKSV